LAESIATERQGLKIQRRPKAQASLEIQLLDFLYGEWGDYDFLYSKMIEQKMAEGRQ